MNINKYEQKIKKAVEDSDDMGLILNKVPDKIVLSSAHAVSEQLMFVFDVDEQSLDVFIFLRRFKSFFKRFVIGMGYIFNSYWSFNGNWETFSFDKHEAERLIGFLKKIQ